MNIIIIQARTGSTRFPRKVLYLLNNGNTILEECYLRCKKSKADKVVIAIPENDYELIEYCKQEKFEYYLGSELDVLLRYYECAKEYRASNVIRITSDCPFIDPKIINEMLDIHIKNENDYTSNNIFGLETFPDGYDIEIMNFNTLKELNYMAIGKHRRHVTSILKDNYVSYLYRIQSIRNRFGDYSFLRFTVDYEDDIYILNYIIENLEENFDLKMLINFYNENKDLQIFNKGSKIRNEGYINEL